MVGSREKGWRRSVIESVGAQGVHRVWVASVYRQTMSALQICDAALTAAPGDNQEAKPAASRPTSTRGSGHHAGMHKQSQEPQWKRSSHLQLCTSWVAHVSAVWIAPRPVHDSTATCARTHTHTAHLQRAPGGPCHQRSNTSGSERPGGPVVERGRRSNSPNGRLLQ
jgi:hypothetical protein